MKKSGRGADETRIAAALERIARVLEGGAPIAADFDGAQCWRWEERGGLYPLPVPPDELSLLCGVEEQIALVECNTLAFLRGRPANHALLTGPRGTGKSSVIRGVFAKYAGRGLRLIETDAAGLCGLPKLFSAFAARREKFIVYCDDLSFHGDTLLFQKFKSALDGGIAAAGNNLRVYATSNRRHLTAEFFADNERTADGEIHGAETIEEKTALSDRFGLWAPFFDMARPEYEAAAARWLAFYGVRPNAKLAQRAHRWADERGSMNGRMARHFAVAAANKTEK
ncbi:MAG: ATP-binding protein [Gammaproteobacteria bacterium]